MPDICHRSAEHPLSLYMCYLSGSLTEVGSIKGISLLLFFKDNPQNYFWKTLATAFSIWAISSLRVWKLVPGNGGGWNLVLSFFNVLRMGIHVVHKTDTQSIYDVNI